MKFIGSKADVLMKLVKACTNARYKIGTTGTLPNDRCDLLKIKSVIGNVIFELKSKELIDIGVLTDIQIANIIIDYPEDFIMTHKGRSYPEEVKMVEEYENRNLILKKILDNTPSTHNILILVNHIKHLNTLKEWAEKNYTNRKVAIISGEVKGKEREKIRKNIEFEDGTLLFATYATCSTRSKYA